MDKVICLLEAKLGDHIRLFTLIKIVRVEKFAQSKVWNQRIVSLLQYTTDGSDHDTSRRRKEIKFQKKLVKCLRGGDLRNDSVEEEKCQTWKSLSPALLLFQHVILRNKLYLLKKVMSPLL